MLLEASSGTAELSAKKEAWLLESWTSQTAAGLHFDSFAELGSLRWETKHASPTSSGLKKREREREREGLSSLHYRRMYSFSL